MKHLISGSWASKWSDPALFFLRVATGLVFFMHGWQKWEAGVPQTISFLGSLDFPMPELFAPLLIAVEVVGGLALIAGVYTRLAAKLTGLVAIVALLTVHLSRGYFIDSGGFEFILLILASCVAILVFGSGRWSFDHKVIKI